MRHKKSKSIVFIQPDYHCSFVYRDELRRMGWTADIYVPDGYPSLLLYAQPDIVSPSPKTGSRVDLLITSLKTQLLYFRILKDYKYHFYNGNLEHFTFFEKSFRLDKFFGQSFRINLFLAKMMRRKIIFHPSGAPDEEMPVVIRALGNDEEGVAVRDSKQMKMHFNTVRRYSNLNIGYGLLNSSQYHATHLKFRAIDLDLWHPDLIPPTEYQLAPTASLRILHSFMFGKERMLEQVGNIKGTLYVHQAVERLIDEGHRIELISFEDVPIASYRFYQCQADIVVEELIRGGWGSTAIECMALGKPVVTYVRSDWEKRFYSLFPDANPLPIVNANKWTIYDQLKKLLDDRSLLQQIGEDSRNYAVKHFNPQVNVPKFVELILSI